MLRIIFLTGALTLGSVAHGQTTKLFNLYRTNYFTQKTIQFAVEYDNNCQFRGTRAVVAYFINTSNGSYLEPLNKRNREYFGPEILQQNPTHLTFRFLGLEEISDLSAMELSLSVSLHQTSGRCFAEVRLNDRGNTLVDKVSLFNVKFILKNFGLIGEHPDGIEWVQAIGNPRRCLIGSCK